MGLIFWRYPHPTNCRLADVLSSTNYLLNRKPQENNHVLLIFPQQCFDLSICHFPVHYSAQNTLELNWSLCCEELTLPMIDSNSWNRVENLGSTAQTWLSVDLRSMHGEADVTLAERKRATSISYLQYVEQDWVQIGTVRHLHARDEVYLFSRTKRGKAKQYTNHNSVLATVVVTE